MERPVKNLLAVDPEDAVPVRKMVIRKIPRVSEDMPLYDILNEFQKGHSHLAVVYKDLNAKVDMLKAGKDGQQLEFKDSCRKQKGTGTSFKKDDNVVGSTAATDNTKASSELPDSHTASEKNDEGQQMKRSPPPTPPAFKKRHRGCSYCILDIENSPIPQFPSNEVVVGVITMEDVIEELLQEEILDETDEYVNIHNRIKINMHPVQEKATNSTSQPSVNGTSIAGTATPTSTLSTGPTPTLLVSTGTSLPASPAATNKVSDGQSSKDQ